MRALLFPMIASVLGALTGAGVGGWITYHVATQATQTQLVMNAYSAYVSEAFRTWAGDREGKLSGVLRLGPTSSVLAIHGSSEVYKLADSLESALGGSDHERIVNAYLELLWKMRQEGGKKETYEDFRAGIVGLPTSSGKNGDTR